MQSHELLYLARAHQADLRRRALDRRSAREAQVRAANREPSAWPRPQRRLAALRRALGFGLVEAGLRLAVGRSETRPR